ncbi:unnamed protein product (macronuclear) [Paramecium tetraurelia]|uniref:Myb-like domain-containing protein n=1 Tax=Paramecium tetraurelia TaxID=5888 RepID=A0DYE4_PARTE|nr:uncharacterized protein GSPATT00003029001 [Paramecium tetraurelia]CAK88061.1 unnamed protein product [Paramecium tetraurelia]|eukprot:XP_001455458.1 hypothetical protein (macronuclear) [Paramecium tetraurelia strain d4-2]
MSDSDSDDYEVNNFIQSFNNKQRKEGIDHFNPYKQNGSMMDDKYGKQYHNIQDKFNPKYPLMNGKDFDHRIEKKKINSYWTIGEDVLLLQLVERFKTEDWKLISDKIKTKDHIECSRRYTMIREPEEFEDEEEEIDLTWTPKEDSLLIFAYRKHKGNWVKIQQRFPHRDRPSLQKRWSEIAFIQQQAPTIFWDIERDTRIISNFLNSAKYNDIASDLSIQEESIENRFHFMVAKLSGQLEKKGVKVELPKKVFDSVQFTEAQGQLALQTKQQTVDIPNEQHQHQQSDKFTIDNILNDQKHQETNGGINSKIENQTKFELPVQQTQILTHFNDQIKVNDEQITQNNHQDTQQTQEEQKLVEQKERLLINDTLLMMKKSLEQQNQHFDSLYDIKDLLLQNVI